MFETNGRNYKEMKLQKHVLDKTEMGFYMKLCLSTVKLGNVFYLFIFIYSYFLNYIFM